MSYQQHEAQTGFFFCPQILLLQRLCNAKGLLSPLVMPSLYVPNTCPQQYLGSSFVAQNEGTTRELMIRLASTVTLSRIYTCLKLPTLQPLPAANGDFFRLHAGLDRELNAQPIECGSGCYRYIMSTLVPCLKRNLTLYSCSVHAHPSCNHHGENQPLDGNPSS